MDFSKVRLIGTQEEPAGTTAGETQATGQGTPILRFPAKLTPVTEPPAEQVPGEETTHVDIPVADNPLLDESDDEEGIVTGVEDAQAPGDNPFLGEDDEEGEPAAAEAGTLAEDIPAGVTVKPLPRTAVLGTKEQEIIDAKNKQRQDVRAYRKARKEKDRLRRYSRSVRHAGRHGNDNKVASQGASEYIVDADGIPLSDRKNTRKITGADEFEALLNAAEANEHIELTGEDQGVSDLAADPELHGKVIYPWSSPAEKRAILEGKDTRRKSRINQKELDFFRNLQSSKKAVLDDENIARKLRAPVSGKRQAKRDAIVRDALTGGQTGFARKAGGAISELDLEYLRFLARFRYATAKHCGRINGVKENSAHVRLKKLKARGLVDSFTIWGTSPLWVVTDAGMLLSGCDLPIVTYSTLSYMLIPHQFTVNNTAANLIGGGVNVLQLDEFPVRNRTDSKGRSLPGDEVVSETEIQSSFTKMKSLATSDVYRPRILATMDQEFAAWEEARKDTPGLLSPEMLHGNEYMWILYPPGYMKKNFHIPDMVLKRPRNDDGTPESIAVEIEINNKGARTYESTLRAYKDDTRIYKKVIWVCRSAGPARSMEKIAKDIGLWQEGRIDIVPVITEDGVFEGRDLWTI